MKSLLLVLLLAWTSVSFAGPRCYRACNAGPCYYAYNAAPACWSSGYYYRCPKGPCNRCYRYKYRTRVYYYYGEPGMVIRWGY